MYNVYDTLYHEEKVLNLKAEDLPFMRIRDTEGDLYHISFSELPDTLIPRLPVGDDGASTANTRTLKEPDVPRVCFGKDMIGCFRAVYMNLPLGAERHGRREGVTYKVYKAERLTNDDVRFVDNLNLTSWVHDANVTGEWWALDEVRIRYIGDVTFTFDVGGPWIAYRPFDKLVSRAHTPKIIKHQFTPKR